MALSATGGHEVAGLWISNHSAIVESSDGLCLLGMQQKPWQFVSRFTHPKANITPENSPSQKESSLPTTIFQLVMSFRECNKTLFIIDYQLVLKHTLGNSLFSFEQYFCVGGYWHVENCVLLRVPHAHWESDKVTSLDNLRSYPLSMRQG